MTNSLTLDTQKLIAEFEATLLPIDTTLLFNNLNTLNDSSIQILSEQLCTQLKILDFTQIAVHSIHGIMTDLEKLTYTGPNGYGKGPIWLKFRNQVVIHASMGLIPTGIVLK
jgi:hypothetical protein